ncbi:MAG TPA: DUF305 domain-containing protein, partial [Gemmatimonadaceae bacterium]|nr:DUF305 domain-containing protein [Gemmatimonadaceae bacterium]
MTPSPSRTRSAALLAALAVLASTACSSATHSSAMHQSTPSPSAMDQGEAAAMARARADSIRHPYTQADVDFMTGMISHHAQAIVMSRWAATHGASPSIQTLCSRIINAQSDEIRTMQTWLRDRREPVPDPLTADSTAMKAMGGMQMPMSGGSHEMLMPGMLTDEQMKELDAARGAEFDRLFLVYMIQHHRGAVSMV